MRFYARVEPAGGVSEALAGIIAPGTAGKRDQSCLARFGRPSQLASYTAAKLVRQKLFPRCAFGLPQSEPGEMEQLMNEDASHLASVGKQCAVKDDLAAAQEASRMHRFSRAIAGNETSAMRIEVGLDHNLDRTAFDGGQRQSGNPAAELGSRREVKLHSRRH